VSLNFEEFRIFTADDENSIWLKLGQKVLDRKGFNELYFYDVYLLGF
jgi:hypothetical protein